MSLRLIALFALLLVVSQAVAQRRAPEGGRGGNQNLSVQAGDMVPDVSGFDASGEPIRLRDLHGGHTVLVFGCLT